MIKISVLQGKILKLVTSGVSTVSDLSKAAKREPVTITSCLAMLRYKGLVSGGVKNHGTCVREYTYTGKPYFAGQCISETAAAIIEAIDLGHTTPKQIRTETGFIPSLIKTTLAQMVVYELLRKSRDKYSFTGAPYWVKSFSTTHQSHGKGNWALCDFVCFKMGVAA